MESITKFLKGVVVLGVILLFSNSYSQTQEWVQRNNGSLNSNDEFQAVTVDNSGNVYVGGSVSGLNYDYAIVKYSPAGTELWNKTYNGTGNSDDYIHDIAVDDAGNVYVTGESIGSSSNTDYATIKYNSSGTVQWIQRYNGTGNFADVAYELILDDSGNVYVGGYSHGTGSQNDIVIVRYNSVGAQQWVQRYNGNANSFDIFGSMEMDGAGNLYVVGSSIHTGAATDIVTLKINQYTGALMLSERYNGPANVNDYGYDIGLDGAGNVYVTGESGGLGTGDDIITVKYNSSLTQQWAKDIMERGITTMKVVR